MGTIRLTIWNEFVHEQENEAVKAIYPNGIHRVIADAMSQQLGKDVEIRTATLDEPQHGLTDEVLQSTDVLTWWGHTAHARVDDEVVERVQQRVLEGMGLIVMHSGHASKIFRKLLGTSCMLRWREAAEKQRVWKVNPGHPITEGLDEEYFELEQTEMYGEFFDIPEPDELVFISWYEGGEVFRSGCTFKRGRGKIFYFAPGHETFPIYYHPTIQRIIANAVRWASPTGSTYIGKGRNITDPLSPIAGDHVVDPSLHQKK